MDAGLISIYELRLRVAPLKRSTIPRFKFDGALTIVRLASKMAEAWNLKVIDFYCG